MPVLQIQQQIVAVGKAVPSRGENGRSPRRAQPRAAAPCDAQRGPRCCRSGEWRHTLKTHVCFSVHFLKFRSTPQVWTAAAALRLGAAALRYHRCCRSLCHKQARKTRLYSQYVQREMVLFP